MKPEKAYQQCVNAACGKTFAIGEIVFECPGCRGLLDVRYNWDACEVPRSLNYFDPRRSARGLVGSQALDFSGVWRFRELLAYADPQDVVTIGEGRTILQPADLLAREIGLKPGHLFLQYEGMNPSGSFKDNGMTAAYTIARKLGRSRMACASTGNTSASLALFASVATGKDGRPMQAIVFIGSGKIAFGKLSQALDYGALTLQIEGDFDACLRRVKEAAHRLGLYLMNSMNPFRLEGQKATMYRVLEGLNWEVPDWIIVPGGNLGNSSAFGKAWMELHELGLVKRIPKMAIINAAGANTLYQLYEQQGLRWNDGRVDRAKVSALYDHMDRTGYLPHTIASAIEISRPVNLDKALRALHVCHDGPVREVSDEVILEHKAMVGRYGFGCEPASAASVAGLRLLLDQQIIGRDERVVCVLTGHELKDPDATVKYHTGLDTKSVEPVPGPVAGRWSNQPIRVADDIDAICAALDRMDG